MTLLNGFFDGQAEQTGHQEIAPEVIEIARICISESVEGENLVAENLAKVIPLSSSVETPKATTQDTQIQYFGQHDLTAEEARYVIKNLKDVA